MATELEIIQTYRTKIVGVTHENPDGKNRQALLKRLKPNQRLNLRREPENTYDRWAVAVFDPQGKQLGYLPSDDALIANHIDMGGYADAVVLQRTGGPTLVERVTGGGRSYGCNIEVRKYSPDYTVYNEVNKLDRAFKDQLAEAKRLEKSDADTALQMYLQIAERIRKNDAEGLQYAACRRTRYPINRISLLLQNMKMPERALEEITTYESFSDYLGLLRSDERAVEKRKTALENLVSKNTH